MSKTSAEAQTPDVLLLYVALLIAATFKIFCPVFSPVYFQRNKVQVLDVVHKMNLKCQGNVNSCTKGNSIF